ncbi:hypothetical protein DUI87_14047 [Hirundo rustica rustica]|uniref:Uncharacterized protein n=1 Tax=Hirundo rustica rustica TaxID=333673 RepID=A0A3M0K787_HIRRU|nr:hypothetical protein DUI87_14047 [Hirundo rustica rustica]
MIKKRWRQIDYSKCRATGTLKTLIQLDGPDDSTIQLYRKKMSNSSPNLDEQDYGLQAEVLSVEDSVNKTDQNCLP